MKRLLIIISVLHCCNICLSQVPVSEKVRSLQDSAWDAFEKNYFKKSIRLIDSSIHLDSSRHWSYMIKAQSHWILGEYHTAAIAYKKSMELAGDFLEISAPVSLGMLYDKAGMHSEAREQYMHAIMLWENPDFKLKYKQFKQSEELEYLFAVGLIGDSIKLRNKITLPDKKQIKPGYFIFTTYSPKKLLDIHSKKFMLPEGIVPLED